MSNWETAARTLAERLAADGVLATGWWEAFAQVPRHVFLPGVPLPAAYANEAVVVQQRLATAVGGGGLCLPTASASQPGAVATMLGWLDPQPGWRVLEIGTGTGYTTALLCHRLGPDNVVSIDLDPQLITTATATLSQLDMHPRLRP